MVLKKKNLAVWIAGGVVIAFIVGWIAGAWGKFPIQRALDDTELQLALMEGRAHVLDARVSLYNVNFGDASGRFDAAKAALRRVRERLDARRSTSVAAMVQQALAAIDEAQALAGRLDAGAHAPAARAIAGIEQASGALQAQRSAG